LHPAKLEAELPQLYFTISRLPKAQARKAYFFYNVRLGEVLIRRQEDRQVKKKKAQPVARVLAEPY